jgi:hypothetical protein
MSVLTPAELMDLVARHGARPGADLCAIAAALSESGGDPDASGDNGHSIGLWQMYDQGLGAGMSVADRADPDTAAAVMVGIFNANYADAIRQGYSGEQLVRYCCMYTERPYGFPDLNCPAADRYVASWQAAVAALSGEEPATMTYDPETPPERQVQGWACSIRTATWMLKSLGGTLDAGAVQDLMVPQYVSPALGLLDGSGAGLADFLGLQTGCTVGHQWVDWAWLQAHAGTMPIGIGSPSMYHWLAVRGVNADGTLALANPAPGYDGVYDTMTEAQFNAWAPWAGVWIELPADENGGDDLSDTERQELESLRGLKAQYDDLSNYTSGLTSDILPPALAQLERARQVGGKQGWSMVAAAIASIKQGAGL